MYDVNLQIKEIAKAYWYFPDLGFEDDVQRKTLMLNRKEDISVVITVSPFLINEFTAPACIRTKYIEYSDRPDTCYASIYLQNNKDIKTMYAPLKELNKSEVST